MKKGSKRVIPGFGLSMGVTLSILSIIVLIPLASLIIYTAQLSPSEFFETVTRPRVLASFRVSLLTAFIDFQLPRFREEGKPALTVAVGCTGGRHRSVSIARAVTEYLNKLGYAAYENHRDITRG